MDDHVVLEIIRASTERHSRGELIVPDEGIVVDQSTEGERNLGTASLIVGDQVPRELVHGTDKHVIQVSNASILANGISLDPSIDLQGASPFDAVVILDEIALDDGVAPRRNGSITHALVVFDDVMTDGHGVPWTAEVHTYSASVRVSVCYSESFEQDMIACPMNEDDRFKILTVNRRHVRTRFANQRNAPFNLNVLEVRPRRNEDRISVQRGVDSSLDGWLISRNPNRGGLDATGKSTT
jgi:hypothetical protein